jgi:hypothetical protein
MWAELESLLPDARFEIRYSLTGAAAVRVRAPRGPVAPRHAEVPDVVAPWSARAVCGQAVGWLVAETPPPADAEAALQRAVDRATVAALERIAAERSAVAAVLLERLTHRLRTDVSTLQTVAEGALQGMFEGDEAGEVRAEVRGVGGEAQRQLSALREVMTALDPATPRSAEDLVGTLERELEAAGADGAVRYDGAERPRTWMPGSGWSACARMLAAAADGDVAVRPDPGGWAVIATTPTEVTHAAAIAVAASGSAAAERTGDARLRVQLTIPAAPSE